MKPLLLAPWVVLVAACGGTATRNGSPAPSGGGVGSEPTSAAGTSAVVAGAGGVGGAGGVSATGTSGAVAVAGGEAGVAGQPGAPTCGGLDCLGGAALVYLPDREWQRSGAASATGELLERDYQPRLGQIWQVKFSKDALALDLTPTAGGATVHGTRDAQHADRAWFELDLFAGGRFVVQPSSGQLAAEYTTYGSGVPILGSTRGVLVSP